MKNHPLIFQRSLFWFAAFFSLCTLLPSYLLAQQQGMEPGFLRIKVSEELASHLENTAFSRNVDNTILTGIQALDNVNIQFKAKGLKRVFREAGKFEIKHRQYGLHLWYEVAIDQAAPLLEAISAYQDIDRVQLAEPIYRKTVIGASSPNYGPVVYERKATSQAATLPGTSNDPFLDSQWHYNNTGQTGGTIGADISLFQAWEIETGSSEVIVAVTDGGIQADHEDLAANMWVNEDEIPNNGVDDDNNGYIDDVHGYGFADNTGDIAPDAHGTHVGGTIAAVTNNGVGVAGVAGGSGVGDGARLMSCAVFGSSANGGFAESYIYGADNGAVISQNSWGYSSPGVFEQAVLDGIDYFTAEAGHDENGNLVGPMNGGIVIFAAGNDDLDDQWYPGYYETTLAVSGTTHEDTKAWYSNFGAWVDIAAPGGETTVAQEGILSTLSNNQYGFFQGTSMACPHVSGAAALIVSQFGGSGLTPQMVRDRLLQTSDNIDAADPIYTGLLGMGRLNAFAGLQSNDGIAPDPIDDLAVADVDITSITLAWTAPADEGNGSASVYDIRYATTPITESNFETAEQILNPPVPNAAGTAETVTISGLTGGTTYYFAIKSADFFGNYSEISNVVEQATAFPPIIAISPPSLSESLLTAQVSQQVLTLSNSGLGPLDFEFSIDSDFISVSPESGTVDPESNLDVIVTFDANGLLTGEYSGEIMIVSNDPVTPQIIIPVNLSVTNNGAPIVSVEPGQIDFGAVFVGGTGIKTITLANNGSEVLNVTGLTFDNSSFFTTLSLPYSLIPFESITLDVTFSPLVLGLQEGTLLVESNDPDQPEISIGLSGEGIAAPGISVSPESLSATLFEGNATTQSLFIENTGGNDLAFSIESAEIPAQIIRESRIIEIPISESGTQVVGAIQRQSPSDQFKRSSKVNLKSVGQFAKTTSVLLLTPDANVSDLATLLNSYPDIEASIFNVSDLPTLSLTDIEGYDVVLTTNNTQWLSSGGIDPVTIGDVLADYVDGGGKVIVNQFAYSYDAWSMEGRFIDEGYGPFVPSTTDAVVDVSLGSILMPDHPVMDGVSSLSYSGFVQDVGLASDGTALATWDNGELFLAVNKEVVALNMLPSLGDGNAFQWTGDLGILLYNAVKWLGGSGFVSAFPAIGMVAPGETVEVTVTFDAAGLTAGTYESLINIAHNVPLVEVVSIPAELIVTGPEFSVSPDSLVQELDLKETATQMITLTNNGTEAYDYKVSVEKTAVIAVSKSKVAKPQALVTSKLVNRRTEATKPTLDMKSVKAIGGQKSVQRLAVNQNGVLQYGTGFEEFLPGDIDGQEGWSGQFGNWTIEGSNPFGGVQHFSSLSDGLGQTLAFSPEVGIGSEDNSTATMKVNIQGSGVTWQIIPQSTTAEVVVTRLSFDPDGGLTTLIDDGTGNAIYAPIDAEIPAGYFDLTIVAERATAIIHILFNDVEVFSGQGFAGDIEQVVMLSLMELSGPTFNLDDIQILDGNKTELPSFITTSPTSGVLGGGESVQIAVTFSSDEISYGKYKGDIEIAISDEVLTVPALLNVVGDPDISVDPVLLQAEVAYGENTTKSFTISNTGGNPLSYSLQVIGAETNRAQIPPSPVSKFKSIDGDVRVAKKLAKDLANSKRAMSADPVLQVMSGTLLYQEAFDGGQFPPSGWSVIDNEGTGVAWSFASDYGEGNYSGTGEAATVSSDAFGVAEFDTELISPVMSTGDLKDIVVQFNASYQNYANLDFFEVDIQVTGETEWTNILTWNEDHGTFRDIPGEQVTIELDDYLNGASSFRLRWHYYDPNTDDYDWYAQIDDVTILGNPRAWLIVGPATGEIPVGGSVDIAANFDAAEVDPGSYVSGILVNSNAPSSPLVVVLATMEVLEPAQIAVKPDSIYQELFVGESAKHTITVANTGVSPLKFAIGNAALPAEATTTQERKVSTESRFSPSPQTWDVNSAKAFGLGTQQAQSATLYETGFEGLVLGDIDGQDGWSGQFGNWTIESINPIEGANHFRGLSDGFGQSLAFSPLVEIGSEVTSSASMMVNIEGTGVTWQIIPQSPTAESVNTRFQFSPDGSIQTLVADSLGNGSYVDVDAEIPSGYFKFTIECVRATAEFSIYFNDELVFTGQGFAGDIEQVVIYSLMEVSGPVFDMDNLYIFDGKPTFPWLTISPLSGIVDAGETMNLTVELNAEDLEKGTYEDEIIFHTNDPDRPSLIVPVTLVVDENLPPVITAIMDTTLIERGSLVLTVSAIDVDDSVLTVTIVEGPSFMTLEEQGNGTATYTFSPELGDAGDYEVVVFAEDERGMTNSQTFVLTVVPYGISSFSLIHKVTGEEILTFTDSLIVDVTDSDIFNCFIRANTQPETVGSVLFKLDGKRKGIENFAPYDFNLFSKLSIHRDEYLLSADAFTRKLGWGQMGAGLEATIVLTNSSSIEELTLVDSRGNALMDLSESALIDISNPDFQSISMLVEGSSTVKSVEFVINGKTVRVDNHAPFSLTNVWRGKFLAWNPAPGHYTISIVPYSLTGAHGIPGKPYTIECDVVDGIEGGKGISTARKAVEEENSAFESDEWKVYPVPTKDQLNLRLLRTIVGDVKLMIINAQGQIVFDRIVRGADLRDLTLSLEELQINKGMYYLKIQGKDLHLSNKFIKE